MSSENPKRARALHTNLADHAVAAGLATLETLCAAGDACPEVQASPLAVLALASLKEATAAARASHTLVLETTSQLRAAVAALRVDFRATEATLRAYERSIDGLARGNAAIIVQAGLLARELYPPRAALGDVVGVEGAPGKEPGDAVLTWPRVAGATSYAVEVSFTPQAPDGTWFALVGGAGRRRVVRAPAPRAQLLARIAAVASDGTRSAWSLPILVTAR